MKFGPRFFCLTISSKKDLSTVMMSQFQFFSAYNKDAEFIMEYSA